ncbi:lipopolysaccharide heptosyltransferase II [Psychromonas sp. MME1]|uniref:lipopolysaccharide heptosyltransferase II n=1 Tax=Psychromonas sp. MME1 TaxID=3231032 RepID=UPI0034E1E6C2
MKILIIGPSWIGDMVMSQGLYTTLKEQYPNCSIDVIAPNWCKPILSRMVEIENIIEMPLGHGQFSFFKRREIGKALIKNNYQQAFILTNSAKSALIPFFANIPKRIGWKGEFRYGLLTDLRTNRKAFSLMIERYIALAYPKAEMTGSGSIKKLPSPSLFIDKEAQLACFNKFALTASENIIGLCPGAEFGPAKRWPEGHFATLAKMLIEQGEQVWLFGSEKDKPVTEQIKATLSPEQQKQCVDLAGRTNLIEAVDLMAACNTVVSNDSGLMHIAAAVGCKVVALYGSTSPGYTPPLTEKVKILHTDIECRPCFKRECPLKHLKCLTEISADQVFAAINELKG